MSWLMIRGKVVKKTCPVCGFDYAVMSCIHGVRTFKCCNCGEVVGGEVVRRQGYFFSALTKRSLHPSGYPADDIKGGRI